MRRELYPDNWESISLLVRARSGGQCECRGELAPKGCGLHRGKRCEERQGTKARWARGKVVLTVHHQDGNKAGKDKKKMLAMCQRCHLRADMPIKSEARKIKQDVESGQTRLPGMMAIEAKP